MVWSQVARCSVSSIVLGLASLTTLFCTASRAEHEFRQELPTHIPGVRATALVAAGDVVYAATGSGLRRFRSTVELDPLFDGRAIQALAVDGDAVLVATGDELLRVPPGEVFETVGRLPPGEIRAIAASNESRVVATTMGLFELRGSSFQLDAALHKLATRESVQNVPPDRTAKWRWPRKADCSCVRAAARNGSSSTQPRANARGRLATFARWASRRKASCRSRALKVSASRSETNGVSTPAQTDCRLTTSPASAWAKMRRGSEPHAAPSDSTQLGGPIGMAGAGCSPMRWPP